MRKGLREYRSFKLDSPAVLVTRPITTASVNLGEPLISPRLSRQAALPTIRPVSPISAEAFAFIAGVSALPQRSETCASPPIPESFAVAPKILVILRRIAEWNVDAEPQRSAHAYCDLTRLKID